MLDTLKSKFARFRRSDDGSIIVETVIALPFLAITVASMFVFFDAYRNKAVNLKANYTISDALSREVTEISNDYLTNAWSLHRLLTRSDTFTRLRVSVIQYTEDDDGSNGEYSVIWSRAKGGGIDVTRGDLADIGLSSDEVPIMPDNDRLIVVHTSVDYNPPFGYSGRYRNGLSSFTFEDTIFTRPREPTGLCYRQDVGSARICPLDSPDASSS